MDPLASFHLADAIKDLIVTAYADWRVTVTPDALEDAANTTADGVDVDIVPVDADSQLMEDEGRSRRARSSDELAVMIVLRRKSKGARDAKLANMLLLATQATNVGRLIRGTARNGILLADGSTCHWKAGSSYLSRVAERTSQIACICFPDVIFRRNTDLVQPQIEEP